MITKNRFFRKDSKEAIFLSLYPLLIYSFRILSQIVNHIFEGIYKVTELSYIRKELRKLRRMSCCLKNYVKKTIVLTPQRPQGVITPLTPLTSEFAKLELFLNYIYIFFNFGFLFHSSSFLKEFFGSEEKEGYTGSIFYRYHPESYIVTEMFCHNAS